MQNNALNPESKFLSGSFVGNVTYRRPFQARFATAPTHPDANLPRPNQRLSSVGDVYRGRFRQGHRSFHRRSYASLALPNPDKASSRRPDFLKRNLIQRSFVKNGCALIFLFQIYFTFYFHWLRERSFYLDARPNAQTSYASSDAGSALPRRADASCLPRNRRNSPRTIPRARRLRTPACGWRCGRGRSGHAR